MLAFSVLFFLENTLLITFFGSGILYVSLMSQWSSLVANSFGNGSSFGQPGARRLGLVLAASCFGFCRSLWGERDLARACSGDPYGS